MVSILPMKAEHIDGVLAVETDSFSIPWTRSDFEREIFENKLAIYVIAMEDSEIVGFAGMWHVINEGHITNVAVLEEYRKKRIGTMLVEELIKIASEKEMMGLTLEVRISNAKAQTLYTKLGFKPEGIRKKYYADTGEDAIIMWKYL